MTQSINDRLGPGGLENVAILSEDTNGNTVLVGASDEERYLLGGLGGLTEYAWANRPLATGNGGVVIYITNVGVGGSYWLSDGIRWRALGGSVVLLNTGGASGTYDSKTIPYSLGIPAGLLQAGDRIAVQNVLAKSGASDTFTRSITFGPAGGITDPYIASNSQPGTTTRFINDVTAVYRKTATSLGPISNGSIGGYGTTTAAVADVAVSNLDTVSQLLDLSVLKTAGTAGETLTVERYIVTLYTDGA